MQPIIQIHITDSSKTKHKRRSIKSNPSHTNPSYRRLLFLCRHIPFPLFNSIILRLCQPCSRENSRIDIIVRMDIARMFKVISHSFQVPIDVALGCKDMPAATLKCFFINVLGIISATVCSFGNSAAVLLTGCGNRIGQYRSAVDL